MIDLKMNVNRLWTERLNEKLNLPKRDGKTQIVCMPDGIYGYPEAIHKLACECAWSELAEDSCQFSGNNYTVTNKTTGDVRSLSKYNLTQPTSASAVWWINGGGVATRNFVENYNWNKAYSNVITSYHQYVDVETKITASCFVCFESTRWTGCRAVVTIIGNQLGAEPDADSGQPVLVSDLVYDATIANAESRAITNAENIFNNVEAGTSVNPRALYWAISVINQNGEVVHSEQKTVSALATQLGWQGCIPKDCRVYVKHPVGLDLIYMTQDIYDEYIGEEISFGYETMKRLEMFDTSFYTDKMPQYVGVDGFGNAVNVVDEVMDIEEAYKFCVINDNRYANYALKLFFIDQETTENDYLAVDVKTSNACLDTGKLELPMPNLTTTVGQTSNNITYGNTQKTYCMMRGIGADLCTYTRVDYKDTYVNLNVGDTIHYDIDDLGDMFTIDVCLGYDVQMTTSGIRRLIMKIGEAELYYCLDQSVSGIVTQDGYSSSNSPFLLLEVGDQRIARTCHWNGVYPYCINYINFLIIYKYGRWDIIFKDHAPRGQGTNNTDRNGREVE